MFWWFREISGFTKHFFIRKNLKWCINIEYIDSYQKNEPNMEGNTEYLLTRDKIFGTIETYR